MSDKKKDVCGKNCSGCCQSGNKAVQFATSTDISTPMQLVSNRCGASVCGFCGECGGERKLM